MQRAACPTMKVMRAMGPVTLLLRSDYTMALEIWHCPAALKPVHLNPAGLLFSSL